MAKESGGVTIIKKKKVAGGDGHHGGAWKVAYADFVTAMMAFFLLMWLLNATTEDQRRGIADYFRPTIPIHRTAGGGDGPMNGESAVSQETLEMIGTGAVTNRDAKDKRDGPEADGRAMQEGEALASVERDLLGSTGESEHEDALLQHVTTRVTDEGLVIELFDLPDSPLFVGSSEVLTDTGDELLRLIADVSQQVTNRLAVRVHLNAQPLTTSSYDGWSLSTGRALRSREVLARGGLLPQRFEQVTGKADKVPAQPDPFDVRNRRIEIVLLRNRAAG